MGRTKGLLVYGSILAIFLVIILMIEGYGLWDAIKGVGSTFVLVLVIIGALMAMASNS
ncbi:hypothetical protein [Mycobacterium sp. KBS0706]|uniref:hypothetical protein n=1 Tax=Mycobacterium sp. KBS0706 TaxID=2578109 RepID=UPI00163DB274|nr:hypothetical protein [Mycobacterium sp. KBS0706]